MIGVASLALDLIAIQDTAAARCVLVMVLSGRCIAKKAVDRALTAFDMLQQPLMWFASASVQR
jgi:hypothetical protein